MTFEELGIVNDMPRGWVVGKGQPRWHKKVYDMWKHMWNRCRNPKHKDYKYYKDCKIYSDFIYLSKYVEWIISEPRFKEFAQTCNKVIWNIDKDMKCSGNRNYYPEFMTLTTSSENSKEVANRRGNITPVIAIDRDKILLFRSMYDAKDKGFRQSKISLCIHKKRKIHKGYKWLRVNYKHNLRLRRVQ